MVEIDTFLVYRAIHADGHSISHRQFTEKLALALIHNNFGISISPEAQSIGSKAVADLPHSTHHFMPLMPLTTLEQYQPKQGCAGGTRRKYLVCVRVFKEENNGHYYCVTCSRPTDGYVFTVCGMWSERGSDVWTGIRDMEFHTLNNKPSIVIIILF